MRAEVHKTRRQWSKDHNDTVPFFSNIDNLTEKNLQNHLYPTDVKII